MATYRLDKVFAPHSVAVVGASPRDRSPGRAVLLNLRSGGFAGDIYLINPHYEVIEGIAAVKSYAELPCAPEIAIIAVPPIAVPSVVKPAQRGRPSANGEYAFLVRSDLNGHGLGWLLMQLMIEYAHAEGLNCIRGQVLQGNIGMLTMCRELGFQVMTDPEDSSIVVVELPL